MNHILDFFGERRIQNPTEADIRGAVALLDTKKGDAFLVLGPTDLTYIQTSGDKNVGFDLEYQEGDIGRHYRATRKLREDEVVRALVSYWAGSEDWRKIAEWERITW